MKPLGSNCSLKQVVDTPTLIMNLIPQRFHTSWETRVMKKIKLASWMARATRIHKIMHVNRLGGKCVFNEKEKSNCICQDLIIHVIVND